MPWKKYCVTRIAASPAERDEVLDDLIEKTPSGYGWLAVLLAFVAVAVFFANLTGLRFVLFPPLVVVGFEMLGHPAICPWASKPLLLLLACFLTAMGGFVSWHFLGVTPLAAACSIAWGIAVLRVCDLHVPPALAVAAGDGQTDAHLSVRGRNRDHTAVALVPRLSADFARSAQ